jgi:hypothetical protein
VLGEPTEKSPGNLSSPDEVGTIIACPKLGTPHAGKNKCKKMKIVVAMNPHSAKVITSKATTPPKKNKNDSR